MEVFSYRRQLIGLLLATCIIAYGECRKLRPFQSAKAPAGERVSCAIVEEPYFAIIVSDKSVDVQFTSATKVPLFLLLNLTETIRKYEEVTLNVVQAQPSLSPGVRVSNRHKKL